MNKKIYDELITAGISEEVAKRVASKEYAEPVSGWMEVFKAGTHTATNGKSKTYTVADLEEMARLYNEQTDHEAPLVVGHPETNDPAYGWAKKLQVSGDRLQAFVEFVGDKIKNAFDAKMFKKVSIALYGNNLLRHIGLLGAAPPSVKGLLPVEFKSAEAFTEIEVNTDISILAKMIRNIRNVFSKTYNEEDLEKIIPKEDLASLLNAADFEDRTHQMEDSEMTAEIEKIKAEFAEQIKGLTTQIATLTEQGAKRDLEYTENIKKVKLQGEQTTFNLFVEGLVKEGKVLAAEVEGLKAEFADTYLANSQMTFSEGTPDLVAKFKKRLTDRPVIVKPGTSWANPESTVKDDNAEYADFTRAGTIIESSIDLDKEIKKYAELHKLSYEQAAEAYVVSR